MCSVVLKDSSSLRVKQKLQSAKGPTAGRMKSYSGLKQSVVSASNYLHGFSCLASFPGPAQLFVACSTEIVTESWAGPGNEAVSCPLHHQSKDVQLLSLVFSSSELLLASQFYSQQYSSAQSTSCHMVYIIGTSPHYV